MSWIANAEAGSSVRAKLNSSLIPIASSAISSPVSSVDVALPAGYSSFILMLDGFNSPSRSLWGAVKANGSFFNDTSNFDTYSRQRIVRTDPSGSLASGGVYAWDSLLDLSIFNGLVDGQMFIRPGDATHSPRLLFDFMVTGENFAVGGSTGLVIGSTAHWLNPVATNVPTFGRIDTLRLLSSEDGSVTPPTATLDSGTYALFGVPTS